MRSLLETAAVAAISSSQPRWRTGGGGYFSEPRSMLAFSVVKLALSPTLLINIYKSSSTLLGTCLTYERLHA